MTKKIQSIPEARLLLESLRSVGYNEETAIADIIDNCISAKAHEIKIQFDWEKKRIVISDDGLGMSSKDLIENMRIGSSDPNQVRDERDLGRFGMGMKTADVYADERKKGDIKSNDIALRSYEAFSAVKRFFDEKLEADKLKDAIEPAIMIQRMLSKSKEIFDNHLVVDKCEYAENGDLVAYIRSYAVFDYLKALLGTDSNGYEINQDVLCAADFGAPQKRKRFIVMGIKKPLTDTVQLPIGIFSEKEYRTVQDAIGDLQDVPTVTEVAEDIGTPLKGADDISELGKSLRDTDTLFNHIITKTRETAMERFKAIKQGENFHSLNDALKTNTYTDANRTQNTIYLRLAYNQPSGTVVNVRKSMWIHPELDRAISIREAARLQTFPDSFIFCGSKDKQYQQVGNAVPPIMARAIAEKLADQLELIEKRFEK